MSIEKMTNNCIRNIFITILGLSLTSCCTFINRPLTDNNYIVEKVDVEVANNWGVLCSEANIEIKVKLSSSRRLTCFVANYPKSEIAEHLRKSIESMIISPEKIDHWREVLFKEKEHTYPSSKDCTIELTPKFSGELSKKEIQEETIKFSIPYNYFSYVNFSVKIGETEKGIYPPFDKRTYVIYKPSDDDSVVNF